jgi:hypothetical protein
MDLKMMKMKDLVTLYNQNCTGSKVKKFESKEVAIKRVQAAIGICKRSGRAKSKMNLIREMFTVQRSWKKQEIMERAGFDAKNTAAAMNILRNPKRTKSPLAVEYDRTSQTYRLVQT